MFKQQRIVSTIFHFLILSLVQWASLNEIWFEFCEYFLVFLKRYLSQANFFLTHKWTKCIWKNLLCEISVINNYNCFTLVISYHEKYEKIEKIKKNKLQKMQLILPKFLKILSLLYVSPPIRFFSPKKKLLETTIHFFLFPFSIFLFLPAAHCRFVPCGGCSVKIRIQFYLSFLQLLLAWILF